MDIQDRVRREKESYDSDSVVRESAALQAQFIHVFRCPNSQRAEHYLDATLEKVVKGGDMLDYGCFDGWMVDRYVRFGPKSITGIDISENGIEQAKKHYGHLAQFYVGDAHHMPFSDNSFDVITGRGILHHLDFPVALTEINRTLRPGGKAIFVEPLIGNPIARIIRRLTPKARTRDEEPLSRKQVRFGDQLFGGEAHLFFNLVSVPVAMGTSMTTMDADNILLRASDAVDLVLAESFIKYWMRQVVLVWQKS